MGNNKVSFEHMQFLVEMALNQLFTNENEHHGWTFEEYSKASVEYAMMSAVNPDMNISSERYVN